MEMADILSCLNSSFVQCKLRHTVPQDATNTKLSVSSTQGNTAQRETLARLCYVTVTFDCCRVTLCGRVIGYRFKSPDVFSPSGENFDGINLTSGVQGDYVWSFVAGHSYRDNSNSPCSPISSTVYYCESDDLTNTLSDIINPL